ncbi:MAG: RNase H family protein [Bacteroidota bacterium]|nr:RNase H family protein [Bacteroidota bacterium]
MEEKQITIICDGSYSPKYNIGTWASIIILDDKEKILTNLQQNTSQHAMELLAVIDSIKYIEQKHTNNYQITVYTDSAYVEGLIRRQKKLTASNFKTKKDKDIANRELVILFYKTIKDKPLKITEIESHKKKGHSEINDYNRKVDQLARKNLKKIIKKLHDS